MRDHNSTVLERVQLLNIPVVNQSNYCTENKCIVSFEVVICIQSRTRLVRESGSKGSVLVSLMGRTTRTQNTPSLL